MKSRKSSRKLPLYTIAGVSTVALILCALYLSIPSASISPADGADGIILGEDVKIDASPLSKISKIAVYVDDQLIDIEYNFDAGELTRALDIKAGQKIKVETKVVSPIGVTREFTSSFETVELLSVAEVHTDGTKLEPGGKIAPISVLAYRFNKPVETANVTIDNGTTVELKIDDDDPTIATLQPTSSLKQGVTHTFALKATARDSAALEQEIPIAVVRPLSFYGQVEDGGDGSLKIELYCNVAFRDPESIRKKIESDLPGADIKVENQKIIITSAGPDPSRNYFVSLREASGLDGSLLEAPLRLSLGMTGMQTQLIAEGSEVSTGICYTGTGSAQEQRGGQAATPADGPPPGWPPCCPWPPQ